MGWNPFAKSKPTPLADLVNSASQEKVNRMLDDPPESMTVLAKVIATLDMMAAKAFIGSLREHKIKGGSLDVLTFEALAFSAWAIRQHYHPIPDPTDPDYDILSDEYEEEYDEGVSDAFKFAHELIVSLAEERTGWSDLVAVWNNRGMHYGTAISYEIAVDRFIAKLMICRASDRPMKSYEDVPAIDLKNDAKLGLSAIAFANTMPSGYAETARRIVDHYGFGSL